MQVLEPIDGLTRMKFIYKGEVIIKGGRPLPHGRGIVIESYGTIYEGTFKYGFPIGKGRWLVYMNGSKIIEGKFHTLEMTSTEVYKVTAPFNGFSFEKVYLVNDTHGKFEQRFRGLCLNDDGSMDFGFFDGSFALSRPKMHVYPNGLSQFKYA